MKIQYIAARITPSELHWNKDLLEIRTEINTDVEKYSVIKHIRQSELESYFDVVFDELKRRLLTEVKKREGQSDVVEAALVDSEGKTTLLPNDINI